MTRIYSHSKDFDAVDVRGSERAYFNYLTFALSKSLLGVSEWWSVGRDKLFDILFQSIDLKHYLQSMKSSVMQGNQKSFEDALETAIATSNINFFGLYVQSDDKEELLALTTGQKLRFTRDHS